MKLIGRYEIITLIGSGGFGQVYLAHDPFTKRDVAIKTLEPSQNNQAVFEDNENTNGSSLLKSRFQQEAQLLARLEHVPGIIDVLDFGEYNNKDKSIPFYVMPFMSKTLKEVIGEDIFDSSALSALSPSKHPKKIDYQQALSYFQQVVNSLAIAHQQGLVHRDLKPDNIMLTKDNKIKIVDFGIAKAPDTNHTSIVNVGMGSRYYTAPEQRLSAKDVKANADVYSLGVLAYRLFTGHLPEGRFALPKDYCPELPQALERLILDCLSQQRDHRPNNANEVKQRIEASTLTPSINNDVTTPEQTETWVSPIEQASSAEIQTLKNKT